MLLISKKQHGGRYTKKLIIFNLEVLLCITPDLV